MDLNFSIGFAQIRPLLKLLFKFQLKMNMNNKKMQAR